MGSGVIQAWVSLSVTLVRLWTHVYTWGAPPLVTWERRAEIDSDLGRCFTPGTDLLTRGCLAASSRVWCAAVADDIAWRAEQFEPDLAMRRAFAVACAVILVALFWSLPTRFASGRAEVARCAGAAPPAESTPEYRLQIVTCAGAFFKRPD